MKHPDQNDDEHSEPVPAVAAPTADELDVRLGWAEPPDRFDKQLHTIAPGDDTARGQAARALLEIALAGRTASRVRIRCELLRRAAEGSSPAESMVELARRLKVTRRTLEKARRELL